MMALGRTPFLTLVHKEILRFIKVIGQTVFTPIVTHSSMGLVFLQGRTVGHVNSFFRSFFECFFVLSRMKRTREGEESGPWPGSHMAPPSATPMHFYFNFGDQKDKEASNSKPAASFDMKRSFFPQGGLSHVSNWRQSEILKDPSTPAKIIEKNGLSFLMYQYKSEQYEVQASLPQDPSCGWRAVFGSGPLNAKVFYEALTHNDTTIQVGDDESLVIQGLPSHGEVPRKWSLPRASSDTAMLSTIQLLSEKLSRLEKSVSHPSITVQAVRSSSNLNDIVILIGGVPVPLKTILSDSGPSASSSSLPPEPVEFTGIIPKEPVPVPEPVPVLPPVPVPIPILAPEPVLPPVPDTDMVIVESERVSSESAPTSVSTASI